MTRVNGKGGEGIGGGGMMMIMMNLDGWFYTLCY